jgi:hypothetical protein
MKKLRFASKDRVSEAGKDSNWFSKLKNKKPETSEMASRISKITNSIGLTED